MISSKKILSRQMLLSLFAAFLVAGIAFGVKEWRYYGNEVPAAILDPRSSAGQAAGMTR